MLLPSIIEKYNKKLSLLYRNEIFNLEDEKVIQYLESLEGGNKKYLEIGSGLGRFTEIVNKKFNYDITCIEKNSELAEVTSENKINTINKDFLRNNFLDNYFDIIHCSHFIEHFTYPAIIFILEEIIRILKIGGSIIIRSPLPNKYFYNDIDHVRPYPPDAIFSYFKNCQQQKTGKNRIDFLNVYYKRPAPIDHQCFFLPAHIITHRNIIRKIFELIVIAFWIKFKHPQGKKTGYILIGKKL